MYYDEAEGAVYSPPSEDKGLVLRVAVGCSHNACTFCGMYRGTAFRRRDPAEIEAQIDQAAALQPNLRSVFFGDGNALVLPTADLAAIIGRVRKRFPLLTSIACAATAKDILAKGPEGLAALREAGLTLVYMGIESGDDATLKAVNKGAGAADMIAAGQLLHAADIQLSAMVILGLAGKGRSARHAQATAAVITRIQPDMLSIMTLQLREGTPLYRQAAAGRFIRPSAAELMAEMHTLVANIRVTRPCLLRASRLYNLLALTGTLPEDKQRLLDEIAAAKAAGALSEDSLTYKNYGIF